MGLCQSTFSKLCCPRREVSTTKTADLVLTLREPDIDAHDLAHQAIDAPGAGIAGVSSTVSHTIDVRPDGSTKSQIKIVPSGHKKLHEPTDTSWGWWSEEGSHIDLHVLLLEGKVAESDVSVAIARNDVKVTINDKVILDIDCLYETLDLDECTWYFGPTGGPEMILKLAKKKVGKPWPRLEKESLPIEKGVTSVGPPPGSPPSLPPPPPSTTSSDQQQDQRPTELKQTKLSFPAVRAPLSLPSPAQLRQHPAARLCAPRRKPY